MKKAILLSLITSLQIGSLAANTAVREWQYLDGKKFQALVLDWNSELMWLH
ncbi:hypothetical protein [Rubritalea tangerina]|uniref:hypothetical protein n=1 Tax=Rubritalea tangerina TaxID=430798 RepID=UPI00360F37CB